jgi:hypothetical protein
MLYSKHGAIFAAESRVTLTGKSSTSYRDDACKVRAIKNKFIFVAAGAIGFEPEPGQTGHGWSGYDEPGKIADQIPDSAIEDPVKSLAQLWGESMELHLNRALAINPEPTLESMRRENTDELTNAEFAGLTKQGEFVMYRAALSCDCAGKSRRAVLKILPEVLPDRLQAIGMGSKEFSALVEELIADSSERARKSTDEFGANHKGMRGPELLGAAAVSTLEFVLKYAHSEHIGGAIDAVAMSSTGDIRWIQRKANCPDQE